MTLNTTFATPFDIPPFRGMEDCYADMNKVDPENAYHSPKLYAIWLYKPYFLREVLPNMQLVGMVIEYAFWNNAGNFRDSRNRIFPVVIPPPTVGPPESEPYFQELITVL